MKGFIVDGHGSRGKVFPIGHPVGDTVAINIPIVRSAIARCRENRYPRRLFYSFCEISASGSCESSTTFQPNCGPRIHECPPSYTGLRRFKDRLGTNRPEYLIRPSYLINQGLAAMENSIDTAILVLWMKSMMSTSR